MSVSQQTRLADRSFKRILLIKPSSLGDVVHALPVLSGLRRRFPDAHVAWLIGRGFAPLIAGHPDLDDAIEFDRRAMTRLILSNRANRALIDLIRRLRAGSFDLVIDLQGLFRSGFFARATGAGVRLGFRRAREGAWWFYTHKLNTPDRDMHAVDRNWLVAHALGFADQPKRFDLGLTDAERSAGEQLLTGAGVGPTETFVAVLPGARWNTKQWLIPRFVEVIDRLDRDQGVRCVLMGGAGERLRCGQIAAACSVEPVNLCGATTLRTLIALIERSSAVLCHDSGPMHLAAALNRPLTAICGPTNPDRTGPYANRDAVIRIDLPCSPCYLRHLSQCRHHHRCMTGINTDAVTRHLQSHLDRTG